MNDSDRIDWLEERVARLEKKYDIDDSRETSTDLFIRLASDMARQGGGGGYASIHLNDHGRLIIMINWQYHTNKWSKKLNQWKYETKYRETEEEKVSLSENQIQLTTFNHDVQFEDLCTFVHYHGDNAFMVDQGPKGNPYYIVYINLPISSAGANARLINCDGTYEPGLYF